MIGRNKRQSGKTGWLAAGLLLGMVLGGCGQKDAGNVKGGPVQPLVSQQETPVVPASSGVNDAKLMGRLHQPFMEATYLEPPSDSGILRPPDKTRAGKSVGKMYEAIAGTNGVGGLWDQIRFVTPSGQRLHYTATLQTDLGNLQLELWPEVAPNHVRNFVALAKVGYYDGLTFDRALRQEIPGENGTFFRYLEAGCPLGTGELEYGSIGYWMKPELSDTLLHEDGTVGAWHGLELESASCKFYITLSKAPGMDGNYTIFGKLTQGLDVAHRIVSRPVRDDDDTKDRPVDAVVIRKVTINCTEADPAKSKQRP